MARLPRLHLADIPQHIIQKGHNNLPCFFDESDYLFYLESLKIAADQYKVEVHAYALLSNSVQLIATPRISNAIASMMQSLGRRYVQYINHRYQRSGTLWSGRYKSSLIDSEAYLLSCYRYVELQPLYQGITDSPEKYRWTSFHHHTQTKPNHLIYDHRLYHALGENKEDRANHYRETFKQVFDTRLKEFIAETVSMGKILGDDKFKEKIEEIANIRLRPKKRGRPPKKKQTTSNTDKHPTPVY
ncbi:MAG: transposase [Spongiibacteraceae bacterium]|nr:transposase [Spongiibacteraceae bacterium]